MNETTVVENTITAGFVLDRGKLSRILDVMEQRYKEANTRFNPKFEVTFHRGQRYSLGSIEELLKLDNAVKNPITDLDIAVPGEGENLSCTVNFNDSTTDNIHYEVESEDTSRASRCFGELEEQVERTVLNRWIRNFTPKNVLGVGVVLAVLLLGVVAVVNSTSTNVRNRNGYILSRDDFIYLDEKLKTINTTDDKVDLLFQIQERQFKHVVENQIGEGILIKVPLNWRTLFIILPFLVIVSCILYLSARCYPSSVFLWGDYEAHYDRLLSIRKSIWQVVIGSLLLGILSSLFVFGLASVR